MAKKPQSNRDQLVVQYGISRRLAIRVAALLARGVGVSPEVLRRARPQSEIERFLLQPRLLREAKRLDGERLAELAGGFLPETAAPVLTPGERGTTLISLGDEARPAPPAKADRLTPALFNPLGTALQMISREESRKLFTSDEISRLKMIIFTSADPAEKIEAIRRVVLSPLDPSDKGIIIIHALGDRDQAVRVEAAKALTALGLHEGIPSAAQSLAGDNVKQRLHAADRLAALARTVADSEVSVILSILAGAIGTEPRADVKERLIRSFRGACKVVAGNRGYASALLKLFIHELEGEGKLLYRPIREILGEIGRRSPVMLTDLVVRELELVTAPEVRRLLFGILAMFTVPEERRRELAALGVDAIRGCPTPEEDCQGIGSMLCDWGAAAAGPLLAALPVADDAPKIYIARLLDEIVCRRGPGEAVEDAAAALLDVLRIGSKHVRMAVIETQVLVHPRLPAGLKHRIAAELIASLGDFANPRMRDVIESSLVRMGTGALAAVRDGYAAHEDERTRRSICRIMSEIVARSDRPSEPADELLAFALARWRSGEPRRGFLAETIGMLCAHSSATHAEVKRIADELREAMFRMPDPTGVLAGLGAINASPNMDTASKVAVTQIFFDLLDTALPELADKAVPAPGNTDEELHQLDGAVTAYTEMLPACLWGLERTYFGTAAKLLRTKIACFLADRWFETSSWQVVWGPETRSLLLKSLTRIAADDSTDSQVAAKIVEVLAEHADSMPMVEALGVAFAAKTSSSRVGAAAFRTGLALLSRAGSVRESERAILLRTLGTIGSRMNLGKDPTQARKLREHIVQALFDGLKAGLLEAAAALRRMEDCPALPAATRDEIRLRLRIFDATRQKKD